MTITINIVFFYYWIFTIIYETINLIISWKQFKKKKEKYDYVMEYVDALKKSASMKLLFKKIFSPLGFLIGFIFLSIVSPLMFPFSLITLFKKLIGYKSKLEKQVEEENKKYEESKKRHDEWMKNEGVVIESEDPIKE